MQKSHFQKIFEYLLDNLFDIVTIVVAAYLVIRHELEPFTANDIPELATWILAVLGLIAVSGLWDRNRRMNRIEKLAEQGRDLTLRYLGGKVHAKDFFSEHLISEKTFESASDIFIIGTTLRRTSREYIEVLGQRLVAGANIRIILVDPTVGAAMEDCSRRFTSNSPPKHWRTVIQTVQTIIETIAKKPNSKGHLEVGYLPFTPTFGCVMIDPDKPNGYCIVEIYYSQSTESTPTFLIQASEDTQWFQSFQRQCETLWKSCRVEQLPKTSSTKEKQTNNTVA